MKKFMLIIPIILGIATIINSCKKRDSTTTENNAYTKIGFSSCINQTPISDFGSITETDNFGNRIGDADSLDWAEDKSDWTCQETNLFVFSDTLTSSSLDTIKIQSVSVYPNPVKVNSTIGMNINVSGSAECILTLVNSNYTKVLETNLTLHSGVNSLNINLTGIPIGNYRMYYVLYNKGHNVFFKGHGDIKIIP